MPPFFGIVYRDKWGGEQGTKVKYVISSPRNEMISPTFGVYTRSI